MNLFDPDSAEHSARRFSRQLQPRYRAETNVAQRRRGTAEWWSEISARALPALFSNAVFRAPNAERRQR